MSTSIYNVCGCQWQCKGTMTVRIKKLEGGRTNTQMWNQTRLILSFSHYAVFLFETQRTFFIVEFPNKTSLFSTTHCSLLSLIVQSGLDVPTFTTGASPRLSPRESTQQRKVELWARNVREFYLNAELNVTFRDLLHAVKLRHGTDGFTSPPKEGVLRIFFLP